MYRLGILGSTNGTDMLALIKAIAEKRLAASIVTVISNKNDAGILERARQHQLVAKFVNPVGLTREAYDKIISDEMYKAEVDLIVLIGYMRILSAYFINQWRNKIINVHPSLLPAFAGAMDGHVHHAVLAAGLQETGCTVHFVTEEVDAGPIIIQKKCSVDPADTVETLKLRVQALEGEALREAICNLQLGNVQQIIE